ncbi:MAG: UxaA family hydrolase [Anaerolineae bacterium]|nr:UxaA family hydrolase [Anaerolineae bacterium]
MTTNAAVAKLRDVAVLVDAGTDHVAVAKQQIPAGTTVYREGHGALTVKTDTPPGQRFAIRAVPAGDWVLQYGQPFARSKGLAPGDPINDETVDSDVPETGIEELVLQTPQLSPWEGPLPTFNGFHRADGNVGVRNWVLIVPASMCAAHEARQIAQWAEATLYSRDAYPNVDGVTAITHDGGCACPDPTFETKGPGAFEATLRMLGQHIRHPNVGAAIIVELGCEKTNLNAFDAYYGTHDLSALYGKPVRRLTIQQLGGTVATIERGLALMPELLSAANATPRQPTPLGKLALGLECGGSDAFSGLTANPGLGQASDLLVRAGGRSVIGEVPEFFGAAHLFAARAASREIAADVYSALEWYRAYAARSGHTMEENPSPGNKAGGLLNITIKSLGAQAKSGTGPVQGVLDYSEWVWDHNAAGVYLLNTPGYDQLSVPGIIGAGCQLLCFTTGRGTGIGNAIAPVIKLSSNTPLYARLSADIDIDAGAVLTEGLSLPEMGRRIFEEILAVASGKPAKAEINGHREFALWNVEGLWL